VTRDVPDHALVFGNPGHVKGWVCACGRKLRLEPAKASGYCEECDTWTALPLLRADRLAA
jgi:hypothetical protein